MHEKLNSMKLINALSLLLLLLGFKRRLQAGAERETAALLFIYLFSTARGCYFTSGGALYDLRLADFREELFNSMKGY